MRSEFKPKHLQRAKETLHRQLEVVQNEIVASKDEKAQELSSRTSLWKRLSGFFGRLF